MREKERVQAGERGVGYDFGFGRRVVGESVVTRCRRADDPTSLTEVGCAGRSCGSLRSIWKIDLTGASTLGSLLYFVDQLGSSFVGAPVWRSLANHSERRPKASI